MEPKGSVTTADQHIRDYIWSSRPQLKGDAIHATNYIFDYCLENQCSIKLAGDIFHTLAVLPEHVKAIFDRIDDMQEAGLPVYYIQGNHDLNKVPWLSLHKHTHNLHDAMVQIGGTNEMLYGMQYSHEDDIRRVLDKVPPVVNTLLMHQAEKTAMPFGPNFDLDWVPPHINTVLIGDIHAAQTYANDNTRLFYPGSPCITSKEQNPERSFLLEKADGATATTIESVSINTRGIYHIQVEDGDKLDALEVLVADIAENDPRHYDMVPLIFIHYSPAVSTQVCAQSLLLREKYQVYTWLEVQKNETIEGAVMERSQDKVRVGSIPTVGDIINQEVRDPDVRRMLESIYTTEDVRESMRTELEKIL